MVSPTLKLVPSYEHQLRKEVTKKMNRTRARRPTKALEDEAGTGRCSEGHEHQGEVPADAHVPECAINKANPPVFKSFEPGVHTINYGFIPVDFTINTINEGFKRVQ